MCFYHQPRYLGCSHKGKLEFKDWCKAKKSGREKITNLPKRHKENNGSAKWFVPCNLDKPIPWDQCTITVIVNNLCCSPNCCANSKVTDQRAHQRCKIHHDRSQTLKQGSKKLPEDAEDITAAKGIQVRPDALAVNVSGSKADQQTGSASTNQPTPSAQAVLTLPQGGKKKPRVLEYRGGSAQSVSKVNSGSNASQNIEKDLTKPKIGDPAALTRKAPRKLEIRPLIAPPDKRGREGWNVAPDAPASGASEKARAGMRHSYDRYGSARAKKPAVIEYRKTALLGGEPMCGKCRVSGHLTEDCVSNHCALCGRKHRTNHHDNYAMTLIRHEKLDIKAISAVFWTCKQCDGRMNKVYFQCNICNEDYIICAVCEYEGKHCGGGKGHILQRKGRSECNSCGLVITDEHFRCSICPTNLCEKCFANGTRCADSGHWLFRCYMNKGGKIFVHDEQPLPKPPSRILTEDTRFSGSAKSWFGTTQETTEKGTGDSRAESRSSGSTRSELSRAKKRSRNPDEESEQTSTTSTEKAWQMGPAYEDDGNFKGLVRDHLESEQDDDEYFDEDGFYMSGAIGGAGESTSGEGEDRVSNASDPGDADDILSEPGEADKYVSDAGEWHNSRASSVKDADDRLAGFGQADEVSGAGAQGDSRASGVEDADDDVLAGLGQADSLSGAGVWGDSSAGNVDVDDIMGGIV